MTKLRLHTEDDPCKNCQYDPGNSWIFFPMFITFIAGIIIGHWLTTSY